MAGVAGLAPGSGSGYDSGTGIGSALASWIATKTMAAKNSRIWDLIVMVLQKIDEVTVDANTVIVVIVVEN